MRWWLTRVLVPALVTVLAVACAAGMVILRPKTSRGERQAHVEPVEVVAVTLAPMAAEVHGSGEALAARQLSMVPQVGGAIAWLSEEAVPGGTLSAGQELARIDARDYQLALRERTSALEKARLELSLEEGRQVLARREWALIGEGPATDAPLALRQPHLVAAKLALEAAEAGVERAELDLERTRLRAPFNAVVITESLELGQVVAPGAPVATLAGTDVVWVDVSLPADKLDLLDFPGLSTGQGSPATVSQRNSGGDIERPGRLLRLHGQLDPATRTARVVVAVDDPMSGAVPLLPGTYVDAVLTGHELPSVAVVPRSALVDTARVWVVDGDDTLRTRDLDVAWADAAMVYVQGGLAEGERVVTSPVSMPVEGTPARVLGGEAP